MEQCCPRGIDSCTSDTLGVAQSPVRVQLFAIPWTVAHQMPLPVGFPRQEYWNGLPFPSTGESSQPRIKAIPPASPGLAGRQTFTTELPEKPFQTHSYYTDTDDIDNGDICTYMDR